VTADERARYRHAPALQRHLIDVLFVHRPKDGMNMRYMWALLASGLGHFEALTLNNPGHALHCEVRPPLPNTVRELNRLPRL
jgi:hypothetical protein